MNKNYIKFTELEDGKILRVSFSGNFEDRQELIDLNEKLGSADAFKEITESYWVNGWGVFNANELNQMSNCLVIAKESNIEEDGSYTLFGRAWSNIHNYQIVDEIEVLLNDGYYDFYLWEDFKTPENFKVN
jgi:hypothetical protein